MNEIVRRLQEQIRTHVEQMWTITEEVSERGELFQRAVLKGHPLEMVHTDNQIYTFNLN
jgi:hypothetical protein